nr:hypothetical protein [Pantoea agglomerans]
MPVYSIAFNKRQKRSSPLYSNVMCISWGIIYNMDYVNAKIYPFIENDIMKLHLISIITLLVSLLFSVFSSASAVSPTSSFIPDKTVKQQNYKMRGNETQLVSTTQENRWNHLIWSAKNNELRVTNTGISRLNLNPAIKLMPDNIPGTLEKSHILPGETLVVYGVCKHHLPLQKGVIIETRGKVDTDVSVLTMPIVR